MFYADMVGLEKVYAKVQNSTACTAISGNRQRCLRG